MALVLSISMRSPVDATLLDFNSLGNGQKISGFEVSPLVSISDSGANSGAAIFDSADPGPNSGGGDADLLVNEGKLLILQNNDLDDDFAGSDFFEVPDDDADGGTISFNFVNPVTVTNIDLVDIDNAAATTVVLTDSANLTRTYSVPDFWTGETPNTVGFAALDLTTLAAQPAIGGGGDATVVQDGGFDAEDVVQMDVIFTGSAAVNNVVFVPEPTAVCLILFAALGVVSRRRCERSDNGTRRRE